MPNMTEKEPVNKVLQIRPDIPIIICTGFSEMITQETAEAIGVRSLLMKPIAIFDFDRTVRQVLAENRSKEC